MHSQSLTCVSGDAIVEDEFVFGHVSLGPWPLYGVPQGESIVTENE